MNTGQFFFYWILFTILVLAATAVAILWSWRAGLFSRQDRARYLALWAEVPEEKTENKKAGEGLNTAEAQREK